MKVNEFKILFDKEEYKTGELLTGKLSIKTNQSNFGDICKLFLKLYDKLYIEFEEHQLHTIFSKVYSTLKKPYQLNIEVFLDNKNYIRNEILSLASETSFLESVVNMNMSGQSVPSYEFIYPFEFQLPQVLQGTVYLPNASCTYFLKCYLTDDDLVSKHYQKSVNVFTEFFKSLNHTYCKETVKIYNPIINIKQLSDNSEYMKPQRFQLQSSNLRVKLSIPKTLFYSNEIVHVHIEIEHTNPHATEVLKLHKIAFKLYQYVKVYAEKPLKKSRLLDYLIKHENEKSLVQNRETRIVLDKEFGIPNKLLSSTSRRISHPLDVEDYDELPTPETVVDGGDNENTSAATTSTASSSTSTVDQSGIRINYKLGIEFWKNFLIEDTEIFIPIMIDPEV